MTLFTRCADKNPNKSNAGLKLMENT